MTLAAIPRPAAAQVKIEPTTSTTPILQRTQNQPKPQTNAPSLPLAQKPIQPHPVASIPNPGSALPAAAAPAAAADPQLSTAPLHKPAAQQSQQPSPRPTQQPIQQQPAHGPRPIATSSQLSPPILQL